MREQIKTKEGRLELLDSTVAAAEDIRSVLIDRTRSAIPAVARKARPLLTELEIVEDDLRVTRALLDGSASIKPIPVVAVTELDELGALLDRNTKQHAIASATFTVLAQSVTAASRIGQILDERPRPQARSATSGLPGTSTQSS
ncbi:MAG: hypothetical protein SGI92_09500 [Bryobacteraceae bacterium]|nr:hypothetical protein [Bryobacteraceae bacterium]